VGRYPPGLTHFFDGDDVDWSQLLDVPTRRDERGALCFLEHPTHLPFTPKRVYYVFDVSPALARGFHAHKALDQCMIALSGSFTLRMDDGSTKRDLRLESPTHAAWIPAGVWHEMHDFSEGSVVLVLASAPYDESDYIRDYDEYLSWLRTT